MKRDEYSKGVTVDCDCYAHKMELVKFNDEPEVYVNWWYVRGMQGAFLQDIWDRIKGACSILFKGKYCLGDQIFEKQKLIVVRDFINETLDDDEDAFRKRGA